MLKVSYIMSRRSSKGMFRGVINQVSFYIQKVLLTLCTQPVSDNYTTTSCGCTHKRSCERGWVECSMRNEYDVLLYLVYYQG